MPPLSQRRAQLRRLYGLDFPDDLFAFWEFARRLRPLEPLHALEDALGVQLVGPFEVLAGRFDGRTPRYSQLLHWRYHDDPPEFFTVLAGGDGLHWGYFLDDPATASGCVAGYYAGDAYELGADGDNLFEGVRLHLEYCLTDWGADARMNEEDGAAWPGLKARLDELRDRIRRHATGDRDETGDAYTDRYAGVTSRADRVVARTMEGMGIVVPPETYRPLSLPDRKLWPYLRQEKDPADVVAEAREALREGFPGTALKLGKDLWATAGRKKTAYAYELLDGAYEALGREVLRRVLHTHRADRDLPSVDILEAE
jgi:hypothetical protein